MRPRRAALVLAALALLPAARASGAWSPGDTLTTILRPLVGVPALVRPGDTFTVWAHAPSTAGGWTAALRFGALEVPLIPAGGGWEPTRDRWELRYTVPAGMPEAIYALRLDSDATPPDEEAHAVKVLPRFRDDYDFAHVSDTHLPSHTFSSDGGFDPADTSGMADFGAVIEDLNVISPEFVLLTGDLVNEGELEDYLGMYEMGRAKAMLGRLRAPVFLTSGNHDIGGWGPTPPPDGTARRNWWRHFGWPHLGDPPPGDPVNTQDLEFDYGPLRLIGLEGYINSGSYDHYRQDVWGAQSFTAEQIAWLRGRIAAHGGGPVLLFYHYDFGGTLPNGNPGPQGSQIDPAALGVDGAVWGHWHSVPEGDRAARPFDLGVQSVIDRRRFRIFRVRDGVITPGAMHGAGGPPLSGTDSLSVAWSGPNDGTRPELSATVVNRYGEAWEHAQLEFNLQDRDSAFVATGGTIARVIRQGGTANVTVNVPLAAGGIAVVTVRPSVPDTGVVPGGTPAEVLALAPNPFAAAGGAALAIRYRLAEPGTVRLDVLDVAGRRVARLEHGAFPAGDRTARWDGRDADGRAAGAGLYFVRLAAGGRVDGRRVAVVR